MDRRITIERRDVTGKSDSGEDIYGWVLVVTRWAEFIANRGQEQFNALQKRAESDGIFRIRHYPGVAPEMRVQCDGEIYDITAVTPMRGRVTGLELTVTTGLTNG